MSIREKVDQAIAMGTLTVGFLLTTWFYYELYLALRTFYPSF